MTTSAETRHSPAPSSAPRRGARATPSPAATSTANGVHAAITLRPLKTSSMCVSASSRRSARARDRGAGAEREQPRAARREYLLRAEQADEELLRRLREARDDRRR